MNGGELFTHLYQREKFTEDEVRIYIGEIIIAIEHLHRVSKTFFWTLLSAFEQNLSDFTRKSSHLYCMEFICKKHS